MKKFILLFSFLAFSFPFCKAQDTLVYKGGEKVAVKVVMVGSEIIYTIPPKDSELSVSPKQLDYIKYKDGTKYLLNQPPPVAQKTNPPKNIIVNTTNKAFQPCGMPIIVDIGIGASLISWEIGDSPFFGYGPQVNSETAVYNGTIEYSIINVLSIGVGCAYQQINDIPAFDYTYLAQGENEQLTRYNITGFCLFHIIHNSWNDLFAGFKIGESIWKDEIISNTNAGVAPFMTFPSTNYRTSSFQLFFGYRGYVVDNVGLHIELGMGAPYALDIGLSFKFNTRKYDGD